MLLKVPTLLFSALFLLNYLRFLIKVAFFALLPLLDLRFFLLVVILFVIFVLVTHKIAHEKWSFLLLCLFLGFFNDFLSLFLTILIIPHILPILVALEVLGFFLKGLVVGKMALTSNTYQEIFPIFYDDYDKNY